MSIDPHSQPRRKSTQKKRQERSRKKPYEGGLHRQDRRKFADVEEVLLQSAVEIRKKVEEGVDEGDALIYKGQRCRFSFREEPLRGVPLVSPNVPSRSPNVF